MSVGLDVAAGAAGFASLSITLFNGCVKGFVLLSAAQNYGRDADVARAKIEWENYRLLEWADSINLESPTPNRNLNWNFVERMLGQLTALLSDIDKLKKDYELDLEYTNEPVTSQDITGPRKGLRGKLALAKPKFLEKTAQRLHDSSTPWTRLRWAAYRKTGLDALLKDIAYFNDSLYSLLETADRKFFEDAYWALMRSLISQTSSSTELESLKRLFLNPQQVQQPGTTEKAIAAAATAKQKRILLKFEEASSSLKSYSTVFSSPSTSFRTSNTSLQSRVSKSDVIRLNPNLLTDYQSRSHETKREMAIYETKHVLIEWKTVSKSDEQKLKYRIEALASLLNCINDMSFHSLHCLGFLKESRCGRYAYVFEPPVAQLSQSIDRSASLELISLQQENKSHHDFQSLLQLLCTAGTRPSLRERVNLAIALAETVRQLHTSGWLHKGIRSENVLFFNQTKNGLKVDRDLSSVFLGGYEYARADNPTDMTELPSAQKETDLYRHPALMGSDRSAFRKSFDLYALGCVLYEIGLWRCLQTSLLHAYRQTHSDKKEILEMTEIPSGLSDFGAPDEVTGINDMKKTLLTQGGCRDLSERLRFATGEIYSEVVIMCLTANDKSSKSEGGSDPDNDTALDIQERVVELLKAMRV